tara:strand:+ start:1004 stop:2695 length:1692 start_codon:yes stop_codon:yes gene_type:complete
MSNIVCIAQTKKELEFILSKVNSRDIFVIPLDLDVQIFCILKKIKFYNPINFINESFHQKSLKESEELIKNLRYVNLENKSHQLEIEAVLRFRLHSILFVLELVTNIDKKNSIKEIVVSGWNKYENQYSTENYFISDLIRQVLKNKLITFINKDNSEIKSKVDNFDYKIQGLKKDDKNKYILLSNLFYNFFRLIKNSKKKNTYFLTSFDNRINLFKRIIFYLFKVRFFSFQKKLRTDENSTSLKVNFHHKNEIILKFLRYRLSQEKNNFLNSLSKAKALDELFTKLKIVSVFSNISRGEYGYYLEAASKNNITSISIPHGTLTENFNEYDKIYKNTIADAVMSTKAKYFAAQSKITEKFLKKNIGKSSFQKLKTGNLIFAENISSNSFNKKKILFAVTVKNFQSLQYLGVEMFYEFLDNLDFLNEFSETYNYEIIVKLHPTAQNSILDLKQICPNLYFTNKKIDNVLKDVFLTISYSSTVIEDSLYSYRPVILLDQWKRYQHCNAEKDISKKNSAVYYLTDKNDLIRCVRTINQSKNINFDEYIIKGKTKDNISKLFNILSKD